jgi:predicted 3-demethylubiquinone-9 3-methyltransferase (glyoxalase superfamily)
MQKITPFL